MPTYLESNSEVTHTAMQVYRILYFGDTSKYPGKNIPDKISRVNINTKFKPFYKRCIHINTIQLLLTFIEYKLLKMFKKMY